MRPLDQYIKKQLEIHINKLEDLLKCDIIAIISPIYPGLESFVRNAIELIPEKRKCLAIVLDTQGGVVEVVERIVNCIRFHYDEITFIVPNVAMSAGTVFVMSGDRIMMDYFSCLGPIDPQILKGDKYIPALSYIRKYEELIEKSERGELTTAEYALLSKLDLGELFQFEQARELSIELLTRWLSNYKFKNLVKTKTRGMEVTSQKKAERASEIADALNNVDRWHTHGRGINMQTLKDELNLEIDDFSVVEGLKEVIIAYYELLKDYMIREQIPFFVHTKAHF
jgi:hypothetical protein